MAYNYPIKVLKKKFKTEGYKPFVLDSETGHSANLPSTKGKELTITLLRLSALLLALAFLVTIVLSPVAQTFKANSEVRLALSSLGTEEASLLKRIKHEHRVISETVDGDLITLSIANDRGEIRNILEVAFKLKGVKEVYTDGKTVVITFVSSGI